MPISKKVQQIGAGDSSFVDTFHRLSPTLHASFHKLHSADNQQVELEENINMPFS